MEYEHNILQGRQDQCKTIIIQCILCHAYPVWGDRDLQPVPTEYWSKIINKYLFTSRLHLLPWQSVARSSCQNGIFSPCASKCISGGRNGKYRWPNKKKPSWPCCLSNSTQNFCSQVLTNLRRLSIVTDGRPFCWLCVIIGRCAMHYTKKKQCLGGRGKYKTRHENRNTR